MIELILDGKAAALKDDVKIKLTSCNPYYSSASTYTYEVELPLALPANREIFGDIDRLDTQKQSRKLDAQLRSGGHDLVTGKATITSVTEDAVKVQLLGYASAYGYDGEMSETYIDELEMGDWYGQLIGGYPYHQPEYGSAWSIALHWRVYALQQGMAYDQWRAAMFANDYCVFYPVHNSTADTVCNEYVYREATEGGRDFRIEYPYSPPGGESLEPTGVPQVKVSPQPFLWFMCRLIAGAMGYSLADNDNYLYTNTLYRRIFIANANIHIRCNKCLSHWTVKEWWSNVEAMFGVVMVIDDATKSMKLVSRSEKYDIPTGDKTYISDVVDEYTVELDNENDKETTSGNVGYADFDATAWTLLPDELRSSAQVEQVTYTSLDFLAEAVQMDAIVPDTSKVYECRNGRRYVWTSDVMQTGHPGWRETDQYRPRIVRDTDKIDVELKFVPAKLVVRTMRCCLKKYENNRLKDELIGEIPMVMLERPDMDNFSWYEPDSSVKPVALDVAKQLTAIDTGESTKEEGKPEDLMYLAIAPDCTDENAEVSPYKFSWWNAQTHETVDGEMLYFRPWLYAESWWDSVTDIRGENKDRMALMLNAVGGVDTVAGEAAEDAPVIDATAKYCIRFLSDTVPDPTSLFIIHNRPYVCEKLEVEVDIKGPKKLITGYFYRFGS